ncbi:MULTISPECIES: dicarboxylate/amino acid:cation symporter [Nocardioides]|uniref:Dicarboxylate/amino acid:cation symporter n=1 Tax=Nocardioides kribbensis TaxID=305517 RepID=A0ABV1NV30_9ACTN|nr:MULTISPECIES: dicarboxylate/amino acid:cation symporter [Nocardioides]KQP64783.1 sodium:proton antiporter [Nocardioides sp. Leaf285]KQQ43797.1 sodium:proton antiporter [Nocardioides sp. Leaf307]MBJ7529480.1 dicarboxylate/amino acid:cation symporter [Nocardioides sp.]MCM3515402.1 dicarboxylate/amino acid:cation symporter [Nocardioides sp. P86]
MKHALSAVRRTPFWAQIVLGLVLGVVLGLVARTWDVAWLATTLDTIGSTFVGLLTAAVPPLVFAAIVVSVTNLREVSNAARLATQTLVWFAITSLVAVTIGITLGLLTNPGSSADVSAAGATYEGTSGSWLDFLTGLVPANVLGLEIEEGAASFNVLQIVVVALVVGAASLKAGEKAEPFLGFMRSALAVVQQVLWWIIKLAPLGTLGLLGRAVATYGWDLVAPLAVFTVDVYVGCLLVMFVVYPVILRLHGLSPVKFFSGAWPAIQLAFVSRSSVGTMPLTQQVTTRNLGVPQEYSSFAVPLGATTKMDGCAAIYPALAAITVAQIFGITLGVQDYLLIAFVSVVGSAATAGLTGAVVMLTLTLTTLGLPLEGVALLLAIDPILDMMRTATNVAGQALVPTIVARREGILDVDAYHAPRRGAPVGDTPEPVREPEPAGV